MSDSKQEEEWRALEGLKPAVVALVAEWRRVADVETVAGAQMVPGYARQRRLAAAHAMRRCADQLERPLKGVARDLADELMRARSDLDNAQVRYQTRINELEAQLDAERRK